MAEEIDRIDFSALLKTEWAYGTDQHSSQKIEFIFEPEIIVDLNNDRTLTMIARLRGDIEDKLAPGQPSQDAVSQISRSWLINDHTDLELREFYYETELGHIFWTLGKQQIVWGKADGLKVLDVVNPQDFGEFILDDFDDSRIPLWTVNAELPIGDSLLQLIWVPDQTYNIIPESDALYAFTSPLLIPAVPQETAVDLQTLDKPDRFFSDADYGMRLSSFINGWDISLNYFYHYHDNPVLFRSIELGAQPIVTITPRYERSHLLGSTFSNAFGDFVVRGEMGYSTDRYFLTDNINDKDGVIKSDELSYVIGLDWSGIEDTFISMQLFQSHLMNKSSQSVRDNVETTITFLARQDFMNETMQTEVLWLHNTNNKDGLIRPKINYEWNDDVILWLGTDIFYGDEKGLFGQFDHNDRIIIGIEWGI